MSHYDTLGVAKDASTEDIKAAYRRLAQRYHPDKNQGEAAAGAAAMFLDVQKAYEVLSDPERRAQYDATGSDQRQQSLAEEAKAMLLTMFDRALAADGDAVANVAAQLREAKSTMHAERADLQRAVKKFEKRSGRIKVKAGENLAQMLLDQAIKTRRERIAFLDRGLLVQAEAVRTLENYEPERMDPPPPAPGTFTHTAFGPLFLGTGSAL